MFGIKGAARKASKKHEVLFYTKPGCPLCDEAREALNKLKKKLSLDIQEIDITTDSSIFERYKNIIPVVVIDGKLTFGARVSEEDIVSSLQGIKKNQNAK